MQLSVVILDGKYLQITQATEGTADAEVYVSIEDPNHSELFPIRYVTWKSGPGSDAYWLINDVDEPKVFRFPNKPHDSDECLRKRMGLGEGHSCETHGATNCGQGAH